MLKYVLVISFYFMVSKSLLEYGEFDLKMTKLEMCKGPKRKNCVETVQRIVNGQQLEINFTVKEDMKTVKGKIIGSMNDKPLFRLEIKNMCDHILLRPLIASVFNKPDHCAIEKGHFHLNVDVQTLCRSFYGGKFMYGNWKFKWIFHNEFCNLQCGIMYLTLTPKGFAVGDK